MEMASVAACGSVVASIEWPIGGVGRGEGEATVVMRVAGRSVCGI